MVTFLMDVLWALLLTPFFRESEIFSIWSLGMACTIL
jgi:hypothetical protein